MDTWSIVLDVTPPRTPEASRSKKRPRLDSEEARRRVAQRTDRAHCVLRDTPQSTNQSMIIPSVQRESSYLPDQTSIVSNRQLFTYAHDDVSVSRSNVTAVAAQSLRDSVSMIDVDSEVMHEAMSARVAAVSEPAIVARAVKVKDVCVFCSSCR